MFRTAALVAAITLGATLALPAQAQDAAANRWSGFYIGGHAGGGEGRLEGATQDLTGGVAGGHIGYNWQGSHVVLGVEADLSWSNYDLTVNAALPGATFSASASHDFLTSVRGRLGFAEGPLMVYGTFGLAYTEIDTSLTLTGPGINSVQTQSEDVSGVIGGVGLEYAIGSNFSLRGEALWFDLHQDFDFSSPGYGGNVFRGGLSYKFN